MTTNAGTWQAKNDLAKSDTADPSEVEAVQEVEEEEEEDMETLMSGPEENIFGGKKEGASKEGVEGGSGTLTLVVVAIG